MSIRVIPASVSPRDEGAPVINGPDIYGASAGKPFLYTIPTTGQRPFKFEIDGLPEGLKLDSSNGRITGVAEKDGDFDVLIKVENNHGKVEKEFRISIGRGLALTPPMGWNSWNAWRMWVDDRKMRDAADCLVQKGLASRGYAYVNIDSCWQGKRDGKFNAIQPNSKFPDMKGLSDYIHSLGLKMGIYSSPWTAPFGCHKGDPYKYWGGPDLIGCSSGEPDPEYPNSRAGSGMYIGINKHEAGDVSQWVEWNIDFLKYDWTPNDPKTLERMGKLLKESPRDFVLCMCLEARLENVDAYKKWAHMWRGVPDTRDNWLSVIKNAFLCEDWFQEDWRPHIGPGGWHDLDMFSLGPQFHTKDSSRPNRLTQDEQIACMTAWALYPSPLILSCDLREVNDFEMRLFSNEEVISVNQDRLGKPAVRFHDERLQEMSFGKPCRNMRIWFRELADGNLAAGFFNLSEEEDEISMDLKKLGVKKSATVRNLWEKRDLGKAGNIFSIQVPAHGAQLIKIKK
ncbi:MAG TPA: putative Ig domain-containing protein [bacterium]|nr:putative Ig domain-containing protein [bacterium]